MKKLFNTDNFTSKFISVDTSLTLNSITKVKLLKKQSTYGEGIFANQFIPKNTYICTTDTKYDDKDTISKKINDLAYNNNADEYNNNINHVEEKTNIIYVHDKVPFIIKTTIYLKTIKDIQKGEELSRSYGPEFWYKYEFDRKYFIDIQNHILPIEYVFIDMASYRLVNNIPYYCFGKCINNKYYYIISQLLYENDYVNIIKFKEKIKYLSKKELVFDITKKDFSPYKENEPIYFSNKKIYFINFLKKQKIEY